MFRRENLRKEKDRYIIGMWMKENPHLKPIITSFIWHVAVHNIKKCHDWDSVLNETALLMDPFQITLNSLTILKLRSVKHAILNKVKELGPLDIRYPRYNKFRSLMHSYGIVKIGTLKI